MHLTDDDDTAYAAPRATDLAGVHSGCSARLRVLLVTAVFALRDENTMHSDRDGLKARFGKDRLE